MKINYQYGMVKKMPRDIPKIADRDYCYKDGEYEIYVRSPYLNTSCDETVQFDKSRFRNLLSPLHCLDCNQIYELDHSVIYLEKHRDLSTNKYGFEYSARTGYCMRCIVNRCIKTPAIQKWGVELPEQEIQYNDGEPFILTEKYADGTTVTVGMNLKFPPRRENF